MHKMSVGICYFIIRNKLIEEGKENIYLYSIVLAIFTHAVSSNSHNNSPREIFFLHFTEETEAQS